MYAPMTPKTRLGHASLTRDSVNMWGTYVVLSIASAGTCVHEKLLRMLCMTFCEFVTPQKYVDLGTKPALSMWPDGTVQ